MKKKHERHLPYFELLDALKKAKGCPLCELEVEGMRRYFDSLLYENVNDGGVRKQLLRSRGYCPRHCSFLLGFKNRLGIAILYKDQIDLFSRFLQKPGGSLKKFSLRKGKPKWKPGARCPACMVQLQDRKRYLDILLERFSEPEMCSAYDASKGLCVPHLLIALDSAKRLAVRRHLIETQRTKLEELSAELEDFCRKHDYRFSDETRGKERDSWVRAVEKTVGRRYVF